MAIKFRRGFKAQAERFSKKYRLELGLKLHDPLCPWKLAKHFKIPVVPLSSFRETIPDAVAHCMGKGQGEFSAITLCDKKPILIIHNDAHSVYRQASNIAHELGHIILGHPSTSPFNEIKLRNFNKEHENEANWMAATLLISQDAVFHILRNNIELDEAITVYGASRDIVQMRLNMSGAKEIFNRSRH
jgi:hypothetical protein